MVNRFIIAFVLMGSLLTGATLGTWRTLQDKRVADEAAARLQKQDIQVTIVEGKRWEEVALQLEAAGITTFAAFQTALAGKDLEGTLFPDTYRFFPNTPAADVIRRLTDTYATRLNGIVPTRSQLILASIVEREAQNDGERATIAGVYQNRLDIGMALEADPTVQYAKDSNRFAAAGQPKDFSFWGPITRDDYRGVPSAYNLYLNRGLPPGPICNPGIKSIQAAVAPADHAYLYFFHRDGQLVLSKTLAEHEGKFRSIRR